VAREPRRRHPPRTAGPADPSALPRTGRITVPGSDGEGRPRRRGALLVAVPLAAAAGLLQLPGEAWAATHWAVHLASGGSGESHAQALPSAPTGVSASCNAPTTSQTIRVSWSGVTHATAYSVYDTTTSASGTYTLVAADVASTSWTSGTLASGTNYWFKVTASIGSNWTGSKSSATGESTIDATSPYCVQP
jgi:hypothetical protein